MNRDMFFFMKTQETASSPSFFDENFISSHLPDQILQSRPAIPPTAEEASEQLLDKLEQAGRVPSKEKFRRMACNTFIYTGACPYNDRCVFLHDCRIKAEGVKVRTTRQTKANTTIKDTFYWPDMTRKEVVKSLDIQGLPSANQLYVIPDAFKLNPHNFHNRGLYSSWEHYVEFCIHNSIFYTRRYRDISSEPFFTLSSYKENPHVPGAYRLDVLIRLSMGRQMAATAHISATATATTGKQPMVASASAVPMKPEDSLIVKMDKETANMLDQLFTEEDDDENSKLAKGSNDTYHHEQQGMAFLHPERGMKLMTNRHTSSSYSLGGAIAPLPSTPPPPLPPATVGFRAPSNVHSTSVGSIHPSLNTTTTATATPATRLPLQLPLPEETEFTNDTTIFFLNNEKKGINNDYSTPFSLFSTVNDNQQRSDSLNSSKLNTSAAVFTPSFINNNNSKKGLSALASVVVVTPSPPPTTTATSGLVAASTPPMTATTTGTNNYSPFAASNNDARSQGHQQNLAQWMWTNNNNNNNNNNSNMTNMAAGELSSGTGTALASTTEDLYDREGPKHRGENKPKMDVLRFMQSSVDSGGDALDALIDYTNNADGNNSGLMITPRLDDIVDATTSISQQDPEQGVVDSMNGKELSSFSPLPYDALLVGSQSNDNHSNKSQVGEGGLTMPLWFEDRPCNDNEEEHEMTELNDKQQIVVDARTEEISWQHNKQQQHWSPLMSNSNSTATVMNNNNNRAPATALDILSPYHHSNHDTQINLQPQAGMLDWSTVQTPSTTTMTATNTAAASGIHTVNNDSNTNTVIYTAYKVQPPTPPRHNNSMMMNKQQQQPQQQRDVFGLHDHELLLANDSYDSFSCNNGNNMVNAAGTSLFHPPVEGYNNNQSQQPALVYSTAPSNNHYHNNRYTNNNKPPPPPFPAPPLTSTTTATGGGMGSCNSKLYIDTTHGDHAPATIYPTSSYDLYDQPQQQGGGGINSASSAVGQGGMNFMTSIGSFMPYSPGAGGANNTGAGTSGSQGSMLTYLQQQQQQKQQYHQQVPSAVIPPPPSQAPPASTIPAMTYQQQVPTAYSYHPSPVRGKNHFQHQQQQQQQHHYRSGSGSSIYSNLSNNSNNSSSGGGGMLPSPRFNKQQQQQQQGYRTQQQQRFTY